MNNLCVIPARGGSKRIKQKNIRKFCGRPILEYSIETARTSGIFSRIIVSTDDEAIADVARKCGADVPFVRPADLSDDQTTLIPVISHATTASEEFYGEQFGNVCCLFATAPLLLPESIQAGLKLLDENSDVMFAFSVCPFNFPILRAVKKDDENRVESMWPEYEMTHSQDLQEAWHDAGQFHWGRREAWLNCKSIYNEGAMGVPLPPYRVQDIDTEDDWERAELLWEVIAKKKS